MTNAERERVDNERSELPERSGCDNSGGSRKEKGKKEKRDTISTYSYKQTQPSDKMPSSDQNAFTISPDSARRPAA